MNESHFHSFIDKLHVGLISHMYPQRKIKDAFIFKKLSDYYFSKLLPDFFYHTPLPSNYYPTIVATRVTLSLIFLFGFSYMIYRNKLSDNKEKTKKYSFNYFDKQFLNYEKELLLHEKNSRKKIILN
jgi:hypothetical protein